MGATAAITPAGVRDGERATLRALSERRGAAVLAFCEQVCAPGHALDAAADAFAHFRAAVVAAPHLHEIDAEALLLSATREAAAQRAPMTLSSSRFGRGARPRRPCSLVPELLATRADGGLSNADVRRLERHLRRCARCGELERRWNAAEVAYWADSCDAPADLAIEAIERALRGAAPAAPGAPRPNHGSGADRQPPTRPAEPWRGPLDVAEPPELPVSLTSALEVGSRAPGHARGSAPAVDVPHEPLDQSRWTVAQSDAAGAPDEPVDQSRWTVAQSDAAGAPYEPVDQSRWTVAQLDAAGAPRHPANPSRAHADARPARSSAGLDHDPDATMAWALEAPDFDGDIVAVDLRERPAIPAAQSAELSEDAAPPVSWRRIGRLLPALVIGLVVVLVALALVGSLAGSVGHRTPTATPAPTATPGNTSSSGAAGPLRRRRGGRHRGAARAHRAAKAGARSRTLALAAAPVPASVKAAPSPGLSSGHPPSALPAVGATRPTAPRQLPSAATRPTAHAGPTSPPPPAAAPPSARGPATPPPSSGSPTSGGAAAPAP